MGFIVSLLMIPYDALSLACFLISLILPWRIFDVREMFDECSDKQVTPNRRAIFVKSLSMTVIDLISIPLALVSLISPIRWHQVYTALHYQGDPGMPRFTSFIASRSWLFHAFYAAVKDLLVFPFTLLCFLSPLQRIYLVREFSASYEASYSESSEEELSRYTKHHDTMGKLTIILAIKSIFELMLVGPILIICAFAPSVWWGLCSGIIELRRQTVDDNNSFKEKVIHTYQWHRRLRRHLLVQIPHVLIDFAVLPFFLVALISPLRSGTLRSKVNMYIQDWKKSISEDGLNGFSQDVGSFEYAYILDLRKFAFQLGVLSLSDILFFPMLLPLYISRYRNVDISIGSVWSYNEFKLVSQQFGFLLLDIIIFPLLLPILFVTAIRWRNIAKCLVIDNIFMQHSWLLYGTIIHQFFLLCLDISLIIPALLVFATNYRSPPLKRIWNDQDLWDQKRGLLFHQAIIFNFLIVFHDAIILFPMALIICLTSIIRAPIVISILREIIKGDNFSEYSPAGSGLALGEVRICSVKKIDDMEIFESSLSNANDVDHDIDHDSEFSSQSESIPLNIQNDRNDVASPFCSSFQSSDHFSNFVDSENIRSHNVKDVTQTGDRRPHQAGTISDDQTSTSQNDAHVDTSYQIGQPKPEEVSVKSGTPRSERSGILGRGVNFLVKSFSQSTTNSLSDSIEAVPGTFERWMLWTQLVQTIIDIPYVVMSLILLLTGWRSGELCSLFRQILEEVEWDAIQFFSFEINLRGFVLDQFLKLIRDVICIIPLSILSATVYKLPKLFSNLIRSYSKLSPLKSDPVFEIARCKLIVPDKGPSQMKLILNCRESLMNRNELFRFLNDSPVHIHILQDDINEQSGVWSHLTRVFGVRISSMLQSVLPLELINDRDIHMSEFRDDYEEKLAAARLSRGQEAGFGLESTLSAGGMPADFFNINLWLQIDSENCGISGASDDMGVESDLLAWNLKQLPQTDVITIQGETVIATNEGDLKRIVLFQLSPTIEELVAILTEGSGDISETALDLHVSHNCEGNSHCHLDPLPKSTICRRNSSRSNLTAGRSLTYQDKIRISNIISQAKGKHSFVNAFHRVVFDVLLEILADVSNVFQISLTLLSPWRFVQLLVALQEDDAYLPLRIGITCFRALEIADGHILDYRSELSLILNDFTKFSVAHASAPVGKSNITGEDLSDIESVLITKSSLRALIKLEDLYVKPYISLISFASKMLQDIDGCESLGLLIKQRRSLHEELVKSWFLKSASVSQLLYSHDEGRSHYAHVSVLLMEEQDKIAKALAKNFIMLKLSIMAIKKRSIMQASNQNKKRRKSSQNRRKLINFHWQETLNDIGYFVLLMLLILTLVRAFPLVRDLWQQRRFTTGHYATRFIIHRHANECLDDIYQLSLLICSILILTITVIGIPSFISDVKNHFDCIYEVGMCARKHCQIVRKQYTDFISNCFKLRTLRLLGKSLVYGIFLVPIVCLAEVIPNPFAGQSSRYSTKIKYVSGLVVWAALLTGSIAVSEVARSAGKGNKVTGEQSTLALVAMCGATLVVLLLTAVTIYLRNRNRRKAKNNPAFNAFEVTVPAVTWSHLLALLTGPLESLQLSAVVMFFFWSPNNPLNFGKDPFSSRILIWGLQSGFLQGYFISVAVSYFAVLMWSILLALPLSAASTISAKAVALEEDSSGTLSLAQKRLRKIMEIRNSPVYEFLMVLISRLFSVWITATLMRASSCYSATYLEGNNYISNIMSTDYRMLCGGGTAWASYASIPLLIFYILTSTIVHVDDTNLSKLTAQLLNKNVVRFHPLYAKSFRAGQFFIISACFGGFITPNLYFVLIPVIVVAAVMAVLPFLFSNSSNSVSNFAVVVPLRSAGSICVFWTTLVCLIRNIPDINNPFFQSLETIYFGWLVIFSASLLFVFHIEISQRKLWSKQMRLAGFDDAIDKIMKICELFFTEEAASGRSGSRAKIKLRLEMFRKLAMKVNSVEHLAQVFKKLEQHILADRLTKDFLLKRDDWILNLDDIISDNVRRKQSALLDSIDENEEADIDGDADADIEMGIEHARMQSSSETTALFQGSDDMDAQPYPNGQLQEKSNQSLAVQKSGNLKFYESFYKDDTLSEEPIPHLKPTISKLWATSFNNKKISNQVTLVPLDITVKNNFPSLLVMNDLIFKLHVSLTPVATTIKLSRHVLSLLLSRKFPIEISWLINSYLVNTTHFKDVFFETSKINYTALPAKSKINRLNEGNVEFFGVEAGSIDFLTSPPSSRSHSLFFPSEADPKRKVTNGRLASTQTSSSNFESSSPLESEAEQSVSIRTERFSKGHTISQALISFSFQFLSLRSSHLKSIVTFEAHGGDNDSLFLAKSRQNDSSEDAMKFDAIYYGNEVVDTPDSIHDNDEIFHDDGSEYNFEHDDSLYQPIEQSQSNFKISESQRFAFNERSGLDDEDDDDDDDEDDDDDGQVETIEDSKYQPPNKLSEHQSVVTSNSKISLHEIVDRTVVYSNGDVYKGQMVGEKRHGKGRFTYANGHFYDGSWVSGKRHGVGKQTTTTGDVYDGDWEHGLKSGRAVCIYSNGDYYEGEYRLGKKSGRGIFKQGNGDYYDGEYKDGKAHGFGLYRYRNGAEYEGEWVESNKEGYGVFRYSNGDIFEGQWKNDLKEGLGIHVYASGEAYEGEWKASKKSGNGKLIFANGSVYVGELLDGHIQGKGALKYQGGEVYDGFWVEDKRHGYGEFTDKHGNIYKGQWQEGNKFGEIATYIYKNGDVYNGSWRDGKRNGNGVFTYANGDNYNGGWKKDKKHGRGVYTYKNGDIYDGEWLNGMKNGQGIERYAAGHTSGNGMSEGDIYDGNWKDNLKHGYGVHSYATGDIYEGEYHNDQKAGQGKYNFANGDVYEGDWFNGRMEGVGHFFFSNGEYYDGQWVNGRMDGKGVYKYAGGGIYEGEFTDGMRHGTGISKYSDGGRYEGGFKFDKKHGFGTYISVHGDVYQGEYQTDIRHGFGQFSYTNGDIYEGSWKNGKKSGEGILKFANGDVYQGDWIGDHMQGIGQYVFTSGDRYKGQITDAKFGPIGEFWYRNGDHYNGEWKDLKRHGHGTFKYANGDVFTGSWHMGEIQGKGQLRYTTGDIYEGAWEGGEPNGFGVMTYAKGGYYEGHWLVGQMHGAGIKKFATGDTHEGRWEHGKLIGSYIHRNPKGKVISKS